jgi:4'-phosphopantetheinyl transferase
MLPAPDTIELWTLPLGAIAGGGDLLGKRERARADRLVVASKRHQFVAAQVSLRRVLAHYLGKKAAEVEFGFGSDGKPFLPAHRELGFNLTHSGDLALVAVVGGVEIGVDLEWQGRQRPFVRLARRYFTAAEAAWLAGLDQGQQPAAFYRIWTLKEAYLKAVGTGLTVPPDRFELDLDRSPATLRWTELPGDRPNRWRFAEPAVDPCYAAAICWAGIQRQIVPRDPAALSAVQDH